VINTTEFYPTPRKIISKMVSKINLDMMETMLEPQAGKGDIADYIKEQTKYRNSQIEIDTIEIDENLRHILKGKGFRVVHDDFLTFNTFMSYDAIIMNPPFSGGDKHLLKALELQKRGGNIVCLLNAETIRNPYTNIRKELVQKLEDYNAEIEYIQDAFIDAERKTDVEVALITVNIPKPKRESTIVDRLRQEECYESKILGSNAVVDSDFLEAIVAKYNFEIRAGLNN
jgi:16S rRNA A1518/A1519 N6-dimethyltransferase RsmA/KsgA/DIM1 with predicted DNA glycosylase/AP lyase activity